jgi:cytidine deaminase
MHFLDVTPTDLELIEHARDLIRRLYIPDRHHVASAVRCGNGKIYAGVHLDAAVGQANVCAEAVAVGMALSAGETELHTIVAVRHPRPHEADPSIRVVSPCGNCRELISDFGPHCHLILPDGKGGIQKLAVDDLLPFKFKRRPPINVAQMRMKQV